MPVPSCPVRIALGSAAHARDPDAPHAQALRARLAELEADHRAAIAAHSALEEHLDGQASAQKALASLQSAHAGLQAEHTRAQAELAVAAERVSGLQDLQLSHDGLQVSLSGGSPVISAQAL